MTIQSTNNDSPQSWKEFLSTQPSHHLLQTPEWAELKSGFGWKSSYVINSNVGAQILFRKLPLGYTIGYIPKGPIGSIELWPTIFAGLDAICKKNHAVFLKIEPDGWESRLADYEQVFRNFATHSRPIQPYRTIIIDLSGTEDQWLSVMKQKTRYNIRLAEKKEVQISESADIESFQKLMLITGTRNEFGVHNFDYYRSAHQLMSPGQCTILQASFEGTPLAAIMVFFSGNRAWYFYGASSDLERNRMPTYLLQFEAMKWAAAHGCTEYDLWGIPDYPESQLEEQFSNRSDGLWGVYRFKRGFGGQVIRSAGAFDRVYNPLLYSAYQHFYRGETS